MSAEQLPDCAGSQHKEKMHLIRKVFGWLQDAACAQSLLKDVSATWRLAPFGIDKTINCITLLTSIIHLFREKTTACDKSNPNRS